MAINLVDLVMKQIGGNMPGIIGSLLGESADRTQGALAGAVPAILGGLAATSSKGGDAADQLLSAIGQQDDSILDNLIGAFGGGGHKAVVDQGSSVLSSILGDGAVAGLVGAISKFSGLGSGSTKSLLGMLAPIVMSVLSREQKSQGLDGSGLMNLLTSQKDTIQGAMPSGLASALGGAGIFDDLMGTAQSASTSIGEAVDTAAGKVSQAAEQAVAEVGSAAESVSDTVQEVTTSVASAAATTASKGAEAVDTAAQRVASEVTETVSNARAAAAGAAEPGGSWLRWLVPLVILLGLLWVAFTFLGGDTDAEQTIGDARNPSNGAAVEAATEAA